MPWKLKSWDVEAVAAALGAEAERDARRIRRGAERERRSALEELEALEALAEQLRAKVEEQRRPAPEADASTPPWTARRSSLRESPLTELFRATDARPPQAERAREHAGAGVSTTGSGSTEG